MGLFDAVDSLFSTAVGDVSNLFTGSNLGGGSYVGGLDTGVSPLPVSFMPSYSIPTASEPPMVAQPVSSVPMSANIPRWAFAMPNLWQALQKLGVAYGKGILQKLYSLMRKFGPNFLVSMLGAAAVGELIGYSLKHKKRRMNVANVRALRRGLRRLKGFERLSHRVSAQLSRTAHRGRSIRRGRCTTCRSSPCRC